MYQIVVFINHGFCWLKTHLHIIKYNGAHTNKTQKIGMALFTCNWVNEGIMKSKNLNSNILGSIANW